MTFNPIYISDKLNLLWRQSKMEKLQFAKYLGTDRPALTRWLDGTHCPHLHKLCDIANRTKRSVDWFLTE